MSYCTTDQGRSTGSSIARQGHLQLCVHFWTDNKIIGVQTITRGLSDLWRRAPLTGIGEKKVGFVSIVKNEHRELTVAGWSYRMNDRGWVIYRDPQTGRWHTRPEATAIIEAGAISRVHNSPDVLDFRNRKQVRDARA